MNAIHLTHPRHTSDSAVVCDALWRRIMGEEDYLGSLRGESSFATGAHPNAAVAISPIWLLQKMNLIFFHAGRRAKAGFPSKQPSSQLLLPCRHSSYGAIRVWPLSQDKHAHFEFQILKNNILSFTFLSLFIYTPGWKYEGFLKQIYRDEIFLRSLESNEGDKSAVHPQD